MVIVKLQEDDVRAQAIGLKQMYQAGFLDGFRNSRVAGRASDKKLWEKLKFNAEAAFLKRFVKPMQKIVKHVNKMKGGKENGK